MAASTKTTLARVPAPFSSKGNHTSGIYADMTVDGPEIGTLVIVVDRARHLPNLKTMGKQDPYCAARLAKEAKKTDTDRRGGQTPRWDQELRFVVRDSPDYHKLKVSVFNDDKKTDLIGETWVQLDHILRPGGGQADDWHNLNIKGRYAGEIRLELTFYDSRPKVEKPRERDRSNVIPAQLERPAPFKPHRSDPLIRKPLPPEPAVPNATSLSDLSGNEDVPLPLSTAQSREASSHQISHDDPLAAPYSNHYVTQRNEVQLPYSAPRPRPLPTPQTAPALDFAQPLRYQDAYSTAEDSIVDYYPEDSENMDEFLSVSDDPYALRTVEQHYGEFQEHPNPPYPTPPRHNRVETLSGNSNPRPTPPYDLLHTQSAPQLGPDEHVSDHDIHYDASRHHYYPERHEFDYLHSHDNRSEGISYVPHPSQSYENQGRKWEKPLHLPDVPPPPPIHRNSAPPASLPYKQPPNSRQMRPVHAPTVITEAIPEAWDQKQQEQTNYGPMAVLPQPPMSSRILDPYGKHLPSGNTPPRYVQSHGYQHHLSQSADVSVRPRNEMASDPRMVKPLLAELGERPQEFQNFSAHADEASFEQPTQYDQPRVERSDPAVRVRPVPISPGSDRTNKPMQFHTPRKSVGSNQSPAESQSSTPYSPDSFDTLNPHHSNHSTPSNTTLNKDGPTPMYSPQNSLKAEPNSAKGDTVQVNQSASPANHSAPTERPIIGSDGRVKDPSDHLPPSSYAPEPERKGNRPTTVLNIKSRFGPRDARPVNVQSSRSSGLPNVYSSATTTNVPSSSINTQSHQREHSLGISTLHSSPLSPTHSNILNMTSGGYNLSSPYPPPVPGKIPLGTYQSQVDEHDSFEMAALSLENEDSFGDDSKGYSRGKARRSRFAM